MAAANALDEPREAGPGGDQDPRIRAEEHRSRGEALLQRGELQQAQAAFEAALALAPDDARSYNKLGVALAEQRLLARARACFERAAALDPQFAAPLSNIGNVCQEMGRLDEAVQWYQAALTVDPEYAPAHHNLGVVYKRMGRVGDAVSHLKRAGRLEVRQSRLARAAAVPRTLRWLYAGIVLAFLVWLIRSAGS